MKLFFLVKGVCKTSLLKSSFTIIVEISVDQMYQIENNGHDMGFLKKFMMENAGAVAVRRLVEKFGSVDSKNVVIFVGMGNRQGFKIACLEEIALRANWINKKDIKDAINFYGNCIYSNYLKKLIK